MTDPEAIERFQSLYAGHHAQVYAYAVSRAGRQLADEVVSEVFLVAWRRLADVPEPALPWLLAVARNTACSQFRGSARQRSISAEMRAWVTEAELSTPDVADEVAERIAVLTALAALPGADRELLTLVAWHGLKPGEAAQVVGCSQAAYFVRLHRARRRLERAMADPPEHATAGPPEHPTASRPAHAAAGPPEHPTASRPAHAAAGPPEHPTASRPAHAAAGPPEHPTASRPAHAAAGPPEHPTASRPAHAAAGPPEHPTASRPAHAAAGPPEHPTASRPAHAAAGPPEHATADSPDPARLGDPVLAHREERSR